jgi:hypothetical protein
MEGVITSLRFYFAKIGVNECNRDLTPTQAFALGRMSVTLAALWACDTQLPLERWL